LLFFIGVFIVNQATKEDIIPKATIIPPKIYEVLNAYIKDSIESGEEEAYSRSILGELDSYKDIKIPPSMVTAVTLPRLRDIDDIAPPVPRDPIDIFPIIKLKFELWKRPIPIPTTIILNPIDIKEDSADNRLYDTKAELTTINPTTLIIPGPYLSDNPPPIGENKDIERAFNSRKKPRIKDDAPIISLTK
tara:strand:+ start:145 stop:717 length:573 start_codon:yes stop_codon:yes gene_type:complete